MLSVSCSFLELTRSYTCVVSHLLFCQILDAGLNATQVRAVTRAMAADHIYLIHGPPGTGKTTAVIEVIRQAVLRGERVLACAASNIAVDNMVLIFLRSDFLCEYGQDIFCVFLCVFVCVSL